MRLVRPLGLGGKLFKTRIIEPYTHGPQAAVVDIQGDGHVGNNFAGIAHIRLAEYARPVSCRAQADRVVENALVADMAGVVIKVACGLARRSEENTSELQSLMRNSYAVFCLKKKNKINS